VRPRPHATALTKGRAIRCTVWVNLAMPRTPSPVRLRSSRAVLMRIRNEGVALQNYLQIGWPFTSASVLPGGQTGLVGGAGCAVACAGGCGGGGKGGAGLIAVCSGCGGGGEGAAGLIAVCSGCGGGGEGGAGLIAVCSLSRALGPVGLGPTAVVPVGFPPGAAAGFSSLAATTPLPVNSPGLAVAATAGWPWFSEARRALLALAVRSC